MQLDIFDGPVIRSCASREDYGSRRCLNAPPIRQVVNSSNEAKEKTDYRNHWVLLAASEIHYVFARPTDGHASTGVRTN
jgi:hypothetical protein